MCLFVSRPVCFSCAHKWPLCFTCLHCIVYLKQVKNNKRWCVEDIYVVLTILQITTVIGCACIVNLHENTGSLWDILTNIMKKTGVCVCGVVSAQGYWWHPHFSISAHELFSPQQMCKIIPVLCPQQIYVTKTNTRQTVDSSLLGIYI